MVKKIKKRSKNISAIRVSRTSFFSIVLYMIVTALFDSGGLLSREAVAQRWIAASLLLGINVVVWYMIRESTTEQTKKLLFLLIASQIIFAGVQVYWERGMAATSTLLLALPILSAGGMYSRRAILATAAMTAGSYSLASVKYFNDYFNEGYRIQLWGSLLFYTGLCFVLAWLVMNISGLRHDSE